MAYKIFEVKNYRKGAVVSRITWEDGNWTSDSELGNSLIASVKRRFNNEDDRFDYLSRWTNQVLDSRLVEEDE